MSAGAFHASLWSLPEHERLQGDVPEHVDHGRLRQQHRRVAPERQVRRFDGEHQRRVAGARRRARARGCGHSADPDEHRRRAGVQNPDRLRRPPALIQRLILAVVPRVDHDRPQLRRLLPLLRELEQLLRSAHHPKRAVMQRRDRLRDRRRRRHHRNLRRERSGLRKRLSDRAHGTALLARLAGVSPVKPCTIRNAAAASTTRSTAAYFASFVTWLKTPVIAPATSGPLVGPVTEVPGGEVPAGADGPMPKMPKVGAWLFSTFPATHRRAASTTDAGAWLNWLLSCDRPSPPPL